MSQKNREKLYLIYGIALSVLTVLLGICLIVSCVSIYKSGDHPFTTESISAQFKKIIIPTALCLLGILGGIAISVFLPMEDKKLSPAPDKAATVKKLRAKLEVRGEGSYEAEKIAGRRGMVKIFCTLLCIFSAVPVLIHVINVSNFTSDINKSVVALVLTALPCVTFAAAVVVFYLYYEKNSLNKEIKELKNALAKVSGAQVSEKISEVTKKEHLPWIRIAVFAVAVALIVLGIFNGGMDDVLEKAIKICTECIGLG